MVEVHCRRCGTTLELPKHGGATELVCPSCHWREVRSAPRQLPKDLRHEAGAAFAAHRQHEVELDRAMQQLAAATPLAFERFCGRVLERMGHAVFPADPTRAEGHTLELRDGDNVCFVACKPLRIDDAVRREPLEALAMTVRHAGGARGLFITTGTFDAECLALAKDAELELWDGHELRQRMDLADLEDQPA